MLGCCAVKTAALRPTCACSNLHLPGKAVSPVVAAYHPQQSHRPNRQSNWRSLLPRALLPQKSEEQSEDTSEDSAAATFISLLQECSSASSTPTAAAAAATVEAPSAPSQAPAIELRPGTNGRGIFSSTEVPSSGKVIFNVPLDTCLVVDYSQGLQLPPGAWPRVQRGLAKDDALPWDIIHALALLDGLAGDGNEFWSRYTNELLPSPETLTMPVCLPEELLIQLEHKDIIEAARRQKQRLADLFPGLSVPICENGPSYVEWAFGCVRSRAFKLGQDIFAFIPFLDVVNHSIDPNTNFEMSPTGQAVNLVSLKEIKENDELTISYTGKIGYTNQRFMAQYGFVPQGGNPFDRIFFHCVNSRDEESGSDSESVANETEKEGSTSTAANKDSSTPSSITNSESPAPVLLSLDILMNLFGDGDSMVDAFSGRDAFMYAALKSLPLAAMESDAAPMVEQLELAKKMLEEVESEQAEWTSSIEEDAALLLELKEQRLDEHGGGGDGENNKIYDPRLEAVVRYRLYRKRLIDAGIKVLRAFIRGS